jgi:two-component system, NarL family, response regulator YdfI
VIRLLIAAPSAVTRAGLESLAASHPDFQVVGSYPDLSYADALRPDVILADFPAETGGIPLVILSSESQPVWTHEALRMGTRALLPRNASAREVLAAVEAAASGMAVIEPQELGALLSSVPALQTAAPAPLTARELEVLQMLAEGDQNKTIAWKLQISEHTVKFHVASILGKLNASSRTEAVTLGIRQGLVLL